MSNSGLPAGTQNSSEELAEVPRVGVCCGCDVTRVVKDADSQCCSQQAPTLHSLDAGPQMTLHSLAFHRKPQGCGTASSATRTDGACIQEGLWKLKSFWDDLAAGLPSPFPFSCCSPKGRHLWGLGFVPILFLRVKLPELALRLAVPGSQGQPPARHQGTATFMVMTT